MTSNADSEPAATPAVVATSAAGGDVRPLNAIVLKRALAIYERAAFLWTSRRAVACSSSMTLDGLNQFDEGLSRLVYTLAERPALSMQLSLQEAGAFKTGQVFVTALVALRNGVTPVVDSLLGRLEEDPDLLEPLSSALTWLEYREVRPFVDRLLASSSPTLVRLGIRSVIAHRRDPGTALDVALTSKDASLRAVATEAVGRLAASGRLPAIAESLDAPDEVVRFWAAWSAARFGDRKSIPVLGRFITDGGAFAPAACDMALRVLDSEQAIRAHSHLAAREDRKLAVAAAGIIGDSRLVSWLLDSMESPELARRAGAAFSLMTGCDLLRSDLDTGPPIPTAARTRGEDAPDDGKPILDLLEGEPDDDLVWPDAARVRRWWDGSRQAFAPGLRHVAGLPIRVRDMARVIRSGNQRQRAAAAMELALLDPGSILMDVALPAHRQRNSS